MYPFGACKFLDTHFRRRHDGEEAIVLKIVCRAVVRSGPLTRGSQHATITR